MDKTLELIQWVSAHVGYLVAIPLLPLGAYGIQILFGRFLPRRGDWLPTGAMFIAFVIAFDFLLRVLGVFDSSFIYDGRMFGQVWSWWGEAWGTPFAAGILYDNLTAIMLAMVTLVSFLIHLFSIGYMHGDRRYNVFFANLGLFSFAMLALLLSDNFLFFFIFWEIMGYCSYALIGHYFDKPSAAKASTKAFLTTRIGDVLLLLGIVMLYFRFGTFSFTELYVAVADAVEANGGVWDGGLTAAGILIFGGTIGKSAQFPLHVWLPDAMEGPTPVSAMIHAATMVSAGVYLVGRSFLLLSPDALLFVALIGSFTAIFAAVIGICQTDIKKVLAYSTISQLGYMVAAIGVGGWMWGLFHLLTHAIFKACLFLGSGSVIHAVHTQEMPEMGGLKKKMPITYLAMLMSTISIAGLPLFAGYYSKDGVVMVAIARGIHQGQLHYWIPAIFLLVAAAITSFYMFRLIFLTFHGEPQDKEKYDHAHESGPSMAIPLIVLGTGAILAGNFWPGKLFTGRIGAMFSAEDSWFAKLLKHDPSADDYRDLPGAATTRFGRARPTLEGGLRTASLAEMSPIAQPIPEAPPPSTATSVSMSMVPAPVAEGDSPWAKAQRAAHTPAIILKLLFAISGIILAYYVYIKKTISAEAWAKRFGKLYTAVKNKFYFDEFYARWFVHPTFVICEMMRWFDTYVIDAIVNGVGWLNRGIATFCGAFDAIVVDGLVNAVGGVTQVCGAVARVVQTGRVQHYVAYAVAGFILIAAYFLLL